MEGGDGVQQVRDGALNVGRKGVRGGAHGEHAEPNDHAQDDGAQRPTLAALPSRCGPGGLGLVGRQRGDAAEQGVQCRGGLRRGPSAEQMQVSQDTEQSGVGGCAMSGEQRLDPAVLPAGPARCHAWVIATGAARVTHDCEAQLSGRARRGVAAV